MRQKIAVFLFFLMTAGVSLAAEEDSFAVLYSSVPEQYAGEITAEDTAVKLLKGISALDRQLRVGDDDDKISLYYQGQLQKSLRKPADKNDAAAWAKLSGELTDAALQKSAAARKYDFEMIDRMLGEAVKGFDGDSKYYASLGDWKADRPKHRRNFGSRMEGRNLYLKIVVFNNYTLKEIEKAVREHPDFSGIILDLRGSPGGMLGEAVKIADLFLDEAIVISSKGRGEDSLTYYTAHDGDISGGRPMAVLVDGQTASAAEVLAAALQEQGRAQVVGTKTFGKGSIQNLINLPGGGVLSLTNAYFYMPSGQRLHRRGIIPDICTFEMPESKNVDNLLAIGKVSDCKGESREDTELELKTAARLLEL